MLFPLNNAISSSSFKQRLHLSDERLKHQHFLRILHFIFGTKLLFCNEKAWMKREGNLFDVTMGAYDGAEVCELVGIFMLNKISEKYNKNDLSVYRDHGLAVSKNVSGPESERIKKNF